DALHYCLENGLMQGMGDGLFNPSGAASRAMIVTILWRIEGCPVVNYAMDFEDVAAEQWYTEAIRWAASEKIVEGYGDGRFGTDDPITREQLAAILYRYEQKNGGGFKGLWMYRMDYVDLADVSDWAYEAICWMNMNGIVEGRPGKILDPKGTASRVEAAAMIQRYCELTK
ncbi:MAG: S-layer homology domain-containing protein, partial [Clostridia bacterium]|nr:S-layer homology domain-containing protein [Clostridia bacterium]